MVRIPSLLSKIKFGLAALLFVTVIFAPLPSRLSAVGAAPSALVTRSDAEMYYLAAVNQLRAQQGLQPLIIDARLTASAKQKNADMIANSYWGHYAPSGKSFSDFIWANSPQADRVGENLARCFSSRQAAFDALVASPTHLANMLGKYTNFGIAESYNPQTGCLFTTMHFADYAAVQ